MQHTFKLIDSRKYFANKIVGRISYFIVLILALLVIDRSFEGGFSTILGFSKAVVIAIWIGLIAFIIISIYFGMLRWKIGEITISTKEININTIDKSLTFPTEKISYLKVMTNKSKDLAKYSRGVLAGGKNYIIYDYDGAQYEYEIFLESIKNDTELANILETIEREKNIKINWA